MFKAMKFLKDIFFIYTYLHTLYDNGKNIIQNKYWNIPRL